jgi:hypothetical protein
MREKRKNSASNIWSWRNELVGWPWLAGYVAMAGRFGAGYWHWTALGVRAHAATQSEALMDGKVHTGTNVLERLRKLERDYMLTSGEMKTVHQARVLIKELYDFHNAAGCDERVAKLFLDAGLGVNV